MNFKDINVTSELMLDKLSFVETPMPWGENYCKDHFNDVCSKGSECSVHPAKAFYYSSINAKSVGSKIKVYNDALTKVNQYFSEQIENPKGSGKQSIYTVSNLEKEQFSDQFSKKDKLPVKHTTLASIDRINVRGAACQHEAKNKIFNE